MTQKFFGLMVGASLLVLSACGKKNEAVETAPEIATPAVTAPLEGSALSIPDAPVNPLIAMNAEKASAFLLANGAKDGVRTLESGLQIVTTTASTGDAVSAEDILRFHYVGKFITGEIFDDSHILDTPLVVPNFSAVPIPGLPEALAYMREGEKATITVPPALAFGEQGLPGMFEPNTALIFDIELIEVITAAEPERRAEVEAEQERLMQEARAEAEAAQTAANAENDAKLAANLAASNAFLAEISTHAGIKTTASGLMYEFIDDSGTGTKPNAWDTVIVHYEGSFPDGTIFESSYKNGEPIEYPLSGFIAGWTEGVALMNVGDKYRFFIPSELAYGERVRPGGPIGPNQALVFQIELLDVIPGQAPQAPTE